MKTSEKIDTISKALVDAQKEIESAIKATKGARGKYADLTSVIEAIKGPMNKHGLAFLQLVQSGENDTVETILLHESGQFISTETRVYCTKPNDPQAFGSGVTYAKRYALQAALGLPTEDDDGKAASGDKDNGIPRPTEEETEVLDQVEASINDYLTEAGEQFDGKCVDRTALMKYFQSTRKAYPKDPKKSGEIANWLIKNPQFATILKDVA